MTNKKENRAEKREANKSRAVTGRRKKEILQRLQDPAVPKEEKDRLMEELYQGIDMKAGNELRREIEVVYAEPIDYFPKEIREKYGLGEFAERGDIQKIKAVMIGHAVGDALGLPVEFCSREELKEEPVTDMQGYGTYPVPAGAWSDDTSMSIAALDSLASGKVDFDDVMRRFGLWYYKDEYTPTGEMFDVGNTCSFAIDNYFANHLPIEKCGLTEERSNGNGSLMRIHPFVLYAYAHGMGRDEWEDLIRSASALTHAHERSRLGCLIYAYVLMHLLHDPDKSVVWTALRRADSCLGDHPEFPHYARLFNYQFQNLPESEVKSTGYVVDTLEAALWCVLTTGNYRDCVLKAVNLGDDADTVAAVAGGLAGAIYGYDGIPKEWRDTLIKREYIEEMCERAGKAWGA